MYYRCLPSNDFRHHVGDEFRVVAQFIVLIRMLVQGDDTAADAVSCRVVSTDDQKHQGA